MQLDFYSQNISERLKCDNLVIFGSSLSNSDFSYFFSVFDDMRILDENKNCRIVFAYNPSINALIWVNYNINQIKFQSKAIFSRSRRFKHKK